MNTKLNELLNSGITLNNEETKIVEDNLLKQCKQVSQRYLNEAKAIAAIRADMRDFTGM